MKYPFYYALAWEEAGRTARRSCWQSDRMVCPDESSYLPAPHQFSEVALFSYGFPGWPAADLPSPALNDLQCTKMTDDIVERINGEIHVWWSYLDQPAEVTEKCYEILSEPQRARISRYKTAQLRNRQTVSDGSLTSLVAGYLNDDPGHIELQFAQFGKPFLVRSEGGINLQFSVSHSSQIGVYAFARDRLIGVDVEEMVPRADWEGVLAMCLSEYERVWFFRLASPRKPEMSYRLWTIKEAYLKAIGRGLSISPADIEVSLEGENEYRFHSINGENERGRNWSIIPFTPATNFSASVVVEAGPTRIRYFHWEPRRLLNSRLP